MALIEANAGVTGSIWKIVIEPGTKVAPGDELLIIESMKMEIPLIAEEAGTVREIRVKEGDPVTEGQTLVIIES
jgi:biotin carboxyl carrier protein